MKKALLVSLVVSFTGAGTALAHHGRGALGFEELDTNKDGQVSREELLAPHLTRFRDADTNKDGKLTADERAAAHASQRAERFAKRDENGDGQLSAEELGRMPAKVFAKLDVDHDGSLSRDELAKGKDELGRGHRHGKRGAHGGRFRPGPGHAGAEATLEGLRSHVEARFASLDQDGSGALSPEELATGCDGGGDRGHKGKGHKGEGKRHGKAGAAPGKQI